VRILWRVPHGGKNASKALLQAHFSRVTKFLKGTGGSPHGGRAVMVSYTSAFSVLTLGLFPHSMRT
jgi:hypothetical protein